MSQNAQALEGVTYSKLFYFGENPEGTRKCMDQHRLLVIEDDKNVSDVVRRVAEGMNFDVRATHDGAEIRSLYDTFLPHIIVLDILMPGMDGFEVLNFLQARNCPARIVILSGLAQDLSIGSAMTGASQLAIVATMAKPFRIEELRRTLEEIRCSLPAPMKRSVTEAA